MTLRENEIIHQRHCEARSNLLRYGVKHNADCFAKQQRLAMTFSEGVLVLLTSFQRSAEECSLLTGTGLKRKARSAVKRNEDLQRKAGTAVYFGTANHCP
jgi:hypothetical protein